METRLVSILVGLILVCVSSIRAQTSPFEKYKFEDGGYSFVAIYSHHDDHPLQKKLGEFYIDDVASLNELKLTWQFTRPQHDYACGYHYQFLLLRKGALVDSMVVNLECKQLRTSDKSLYFDLKKLDRLGRGTKKLEPDIVEFTNVSEARTYFRKASSSPDFVYARPPGWLEFEGEFRFRTKCPEQRLDCYIKFDDFKPELEREIAGKYPGEKFRLRPAGGTSDGEIFVLVESDKSLADRFDLYDRWDRQGFGSWSPYNLRLKLYRKPIP